MPLEVTLPYASTGMLAWWGNDAANARQARMAARTAHAAWFGEVLRSGCTCPPR